MRFDLYDSVGVLHCKCFAGEQDSAHQSLISQLQELREHQYVRVFGKPSFDKGISLLLTGIRRITDFNEISFHDIEVMANAMYDKQDQSTARPSAFSQPDHRTMDSQTHIDAYMKKETVSQPSSAMRARAFYSFDRESSIDPVEQEVRDSNCGRAEWPGSQSVHALKGWTSNDGGTKMRGSARADEPQSLNRSSTDLESKVLACVREHPGNSARGQGVPETIIANRLNQPAHVIRSDGCSNFAV